MLRRLAAIIAVVVVFAASASAQDHETLGQERFRRGAQLYGSHQFDQALDEFRASNELLPSPNSRLFMARCLRELNRIDEAVGQYRFAVAEATERARMDPRYAPTREAATRELQAIEPRVGAVILRGRELPSGTVIHVGQRAVPLEGLNVEIPMMPGTFVVTVDAPDHDVFTTQLRVDAGHTAAIELHVGPAHETGVLMLEPGSPYGPLTADAGRHGAGGNVQHGRESPDAQSPLAIAGWFGIGLGVAALATSGLFGALSTEQSDTIIVDCRAMPTCPSSESPVIATGQMYQTVTDVTLAAGIGLTVLGVIAEVVANVHRGARARETVRFGTRVTVSF